MTTFWWIVGSGLLMSLIALVGSVTLILKPGTLQKANTIQRFAAVMLAKIDIGIDERDRAAIAEELSRVLADSYTLYLKTHNFHWNVVGPMFNTPIKEETGVPDASAMIRQLVDGQETVVRTARKAFTVAEQARDQPTADLLTQRMETHEKNAWMLRSLLE